jgi:hypothetical protein
LPKFMRSDEIPLSDRKLNNRFKTLRTRSTSVINKSNVTLNTSTTRFSSTESMKIDTTEVLDQFTVYFAFGG